MPLCIFIFYQLCPFNFFDNINFIKTNGLHDFSFTGLEKLSSLKNLEILDLNSNSIENGIFPSLDALTSLRALNLGHNGLEGCFPVLGMPFVLPTLLILLQ